MSGPPLERRASLVRGDESDPYGVSELAASTEHLVGVTLVLFVELDRCEEP